MIRSISIQNAHGRIKTAHNLTGVDLFVGRNGAGKSTTIGVVELVLRGPAAGVFPVLGVTAYDWTAAVDIDGRIIRRSGATHALAIDGAKAPVKKAQEQVNALVGEAGTFALGDVLSMKAQDQTRFLEKVYARSASTWETLDPATAAALKGAHEALLPFYGLAEIAEGPEKGAKAIPFGSGLTLDLSPPDWAARAAWHTEQAVPALAAKQKSLTATIQGLVDPTDLPPGTTAQAKQQVEDLEARIKSQAEAEKVWQATQATLTRLEKELMTIAAEDQADPFPSAPAPVSAATLSRKTLLERRLAPARELQKDQEARAAAAHASCAALEARLQALPLPVAGPLADAARALLGALEPLDLPEAVKVQCVDLEERLGGDPTAEIVADGLRAELEEARRTLTRIEDTLRRTREVNAPQIQALEAVEAEIRATQTAVDGYDLALADWRKRNDARAKRREAAKTEQQGITDKMGDWSGADMLAADRASLADAKRALSALTQADGIQLARANATSAAQKVDEALKAIKGARANILAARAGFLAEVVAPILAPANDLIGKVIPGARIVMDDGAGWGWHLVMPDGAHGTGSHSERTIAEAALTAAILNRLGGLRVLVVDDLEQVDAPRRERFLSALVDEVQSGRLDNALIAMVDQGWVAPVGVNTITV